VGRGENDFSFGPIARGDDARGSGYMRRARSRRGGWSIAPVRGGGSGRAAVTCARRQRSRLTSGPDIFLFIKIFKHSHFDIRIGDLPDVEISPNISQG
jgi:hypothetical protein